MLGEVGSWIMYLDLDGWVSLDGSWPVGVDAYWTVGGYLAG